MRSKSSIVGISLLLLFGGCKATETSSVNGNQNKSVAQAESNAANPDNSNRVAPTDAQNENASAETKKDAAPLPEKGDPFTQLVGTYEAREVHDKGIVTLVSKIKTTITFSPKGTYSRVSRVGGEIYHSDSGEFRIQSPDRLVLVIQVSKEKNVPKIQSPPLQRRHTFSLSPDGEELKLTSDKGTVAVYRRIAKP